MLRVLYKELAKIFITVFTSNMRVNYITNYANQINTFISADKNRKADNVSFSANNEEKYQQRKAQLDKLGISDEAIKKISHYGKARYDRAVHLLEQGCYEENIEKASRYHAEKYRRANELLRHNIFDVSMTSLVDLNDERFLRTLDLSDKGVDSDCLVLYSQLKDKDYSKTLSNMENGYTPISSLYMAKLSAKKREEYLKYIEKDISPENAYDLVRLDKEKKAKALSYIKNGISCSEAVNISLMEDNQQKRALELIKRNLSDSAAVDIAGLPEQSQALADEMIDGGVYSDCISDIVEIETGKVKVPEYNAYRERGYSRTSSYALAMFNEDEGKVVTLLMGKNPEIETLFNDEYYMELNTIQNKNVVEIAMKKELILPDGTKITITRTFDEEGNKTASRTEETPKHATSSFSPNGSDLYRIKYDKAGDIREMDRFIVSPETGEVTGVEHTKQSNLLKGAYQSVIYDIKDFKTSSNDEFIDEDIPNCVISKGKPIATVGKKQNGAVFLNENFESSGCNTKRYYEESKDDNGKINFSYYSYKINDEKGNPILDTDRSFIRSRNGNAVNIINGVFYELVYDDDNRVITILDGKKSKIINFNDKSGYYSKDVIWEIAKNLQVDTLLTLDKNIKKWNYCEDSDSGANGYTKTLSSGKNPDIINHETGHFKDFELKEISNTPEFLSVYTKEIDDFFKNIPYNEQDFALYCTPKVCSDDVTGVNEFFAEANIVLSSYGNSGNHLKTRPQFLVRYFPRSIAKVAELTGKNSRKSLLDE